MTCGSRTRCAATGEPLADRPRSRLRPPRLGAAARPARGATSRSCSFDNRGVGESDVPAGPVHGRAAGRRRGRRARRRGHRARARVRRQPRRLHRAGARARASRARATSSCSRRRRPAGRGRIRCRQQALEAFGAFPTMEREAGLRLMVENSLGDRGVRDGRSSSRRSSRTGSRMRRRSRAGRRRPCAGATFDAYDRRRRDRGADARRARAAPTTSSTRATRELLGERDPGRAPRARSRRRGHLLVWERPERVRRAREGVPRMSRAHDRPLDPRPRAARRRSASRSTISGAT